LAAEDWPDQQAKPDPTVDALAGVVYVIDPEWPLDIADLAWWLAVVLAVVGYLAVRLRVGAGGPRTGARRTPDP
jgi:hypothetical protein